MIRSLLTLAAVASAALVAGCAALPPTSGMLTYESAPLGATIYEGGKPLGVAPVTRTYPSDGKSPDIRTPEVTAMWPSGAKTTFWTMIKVGDDRVTTMARPANAPNVAMDEANAQKYASESAADAARRKQQTQSDIARASARCQAQMSGNVGGGGPGVDACQ
jgi:hypothetical protein